MHDAHGLFRAHEIVSAHDFPRERFRDMPDGRKCVLYPDMYVANRNAPVAQLLGKRIYAS